MEKEVKITVKPTKDNFSNQVADSVDQTFSQAYSTLNEKVKEKARQAAQENADKLSAAYARNFIELQKTYPELVRHMISYAYLGDYLFAFGPENPKLLVFPYVNFIGFVNYVSINSWKDIHFLIKKYPNPQKTQKSYLTKYNL